jgi:hypothetical protein
MGGNQPFDMKTFLALFDKHKKINLAVMNIEKDVETDHKA